MRRGTILSAIVMGIHRHFLPFISVPGSSTREARAFQFSHNKFSSAPTKFMIEVVLRPHELR